MSAGQQDGRQGGSIVPGTFRNVSADVGSTGGTGSISAPHAGAELVEAVRAAVVQAMREELPRLLAGFVPANDADLLDVDAAAQRLGLKPATVYKRSAKCELPSVKLGSRVLFRAADLDAYAAARRRSPEKVKAIADRGGQRGADK